MIGEKLIPNAVANDFREMGLEETPEFDEYEYDSVEGTLDEPPEELEPTADLITDVYLNTYIILP